MVDWLGGIELRSRDKRKEGEINKWGTQPLEIQNGGKTGGTDQWEAATVSSQRTNRTGATQLTTLANHKQYFPLFPFPLPSLIPLFL